MISIREQNYGLDVALFGEFVLEDFKSFETALLEYLEKNDRPDVLVDLTEIVDFTVDMAIEELRFMRAHEHDFGRIAVVVNDGWISLATHISGLLTHTNLMHFDSLEAAQAWLNERAEPSA